MIQHLGNKSLRNILFAVILGLGIALSIIVSAFSYYADKKLIQAEFNEAVENRYSALKRELDSNIAVLTSLQALYHSSGKGIERSEFQDFARHILKQHASIQALEWMPRVPDSRREAYERAARREGFPDFQFTERIAQGKMKRAEKRKEYFPVYFVEPYKGNEIALGFDDASTPDRLETLEVARKTGETRATARITLVQETRSQFGFIVFAPIYRKGVLINSAQARWDNLEGFALGVFRIGNTVEKSLSYVNPEAVDFFIYDASAPEKERFLYAHSSRTRKTPLLTQNHPETDFISSKTLEVAGRKWMVVYSATPDFIAARSSWRPWGLLLAGLAFTGLVAGFLLIVSHAEHIEKFAKDLSDVNINLSDEIMERKRAEEKLTESKQMLEDITQGINESILLISKDFRILWANKAALRLTGLSTEELVGNYCYKATHHREQPCEPPLDPCPAYKLLKTGYPSVEEHTHYDKDGNKLFVEVSAYPIRNASSEIVNFVHTSIDVTERKKTEEDLRSKQQQLEELNATLEQRVQEEIVLRQEKEQLLFQQSRMAAMGEMIGAIAHQWRQPLNVTGLIIQNLQMAYEYGELDKERLNNAVATAMWQINFMSKTIDDFRNFFKPSKEKELFEVRKVVDATVSLMKAQLQNNYIDVEIIVEKEGLVINGYPNEFKHVLLNLINNAKDAILMRKAKENCEARITIEISETDNRVILKIRDTGGGIREDIMDKIFDPYFTTKDEGTGTGIGLYISKTMIERNMGGRLTVRNWKEGAEFRIEL